MKRITFLNLFFWAIFVIIPGLAWSEPEIYHSMEEKKNAGVMANISDSITLGGVVEVEAGFVNEDDTVKGDSSDISLVTAEIGLEARVNRNVEAKMLLLYEDGEDFTVDEGTITMTGPYGEYLTVGKMYVPFGVFNSHFISDPLTLELGETNETALIIGYSKDMIDFSAGVFNGDIDEAGEDDKADDYVASIKVTPVEGITFGASYISDISDTDAEITVAFGNISSQGNTEIVAGYSAFISASFGPVTLEAEYLTAAEKFNAADITIEPQPSTFNIELAYAISEAAEIAIRYEGAEDFEIEKQYGIAYSRELYENTSFALEYIAGEYENDDERTAVTAQLAIEF
ncbi:MAG: LbtU family siderophore porin [bacterium]|nr:LbtU family siderophore porin [bacterium]